MGRVSQNGGRKWLIGNGRVFTIFDFCPILASKPRIDANGRES